MASSSGSGGLLPEAPTPEEIQAGFDQWYEHFGPTPPSLSGSEYRHVGCGEPYCFLCGRPASAFPEYDDLIDPRWDKPTRATAVENEEGTYNPETNRFACDECYIRIGTPSRPGGWKAP